MLASITEVLAFISPPLQSVLDLTPISVPASHFMFMGEQGLVVKHVLY